MCPHYFVQRRALTACAALLALVACAVGARPALALGHLSGFVYIDRNNDGVLTFEGSPLPELVLPGVSIQLFNLGSGSPVLQATTTTNNIGQYLFPNLSAGMYALAQLQPVEYLDGLDTLGQIRDASNQLNPPGSAIGSASNNAFTGITLTLDARGDLYNFGELGLAPAFVSKRYLLGTAPAPVFAPPDLEVVPEPAAGLLAVAAFFATAASRRRGVRARLSQA